MTQRPLACGHTGMAKAGDNFVFCDSCRTWVRVLKEP